MYTLVWLVLLSISNLVSTQDLSAADNVLLPKSVFLLAGQSNMAGRGGIVDGKWNGYVPPECASNPRILRLNAAGQWEEAHEPLHVDIDVGKICGIGPGMPFANTVLRTKNLDRIGLVPCAVGGTNIVQWSHGSQLYNNLLKRARAAVANGGGLIEAMLWYQGETDTKSKNEAEKHEERFERFVADLRSDLNLTNLPIIQVAVRSGLDAKNLAILRSAQLRSRIQYVTTVDVLGLNLCDPVHLDGESQVKLGRLLGEVFTNNMSVGQGVSISYDADSRHPLTTVHYSLHNSYPLGPSADLAPLPPLSAGLSAPPASLQDKSHATKSFKICFLDFLLGWILFTYVICVGY